MRFLPCTATLSLYGNDFSLLHHTSHCCVRCQVSLEVSLQPWRAYGVDGVILFSDILTPLPAMGVDFSISEAGGISIDPIRTREAFKKMTERPFDPVKEVPFVGSVLKRLREEVGPSGATVLGFVGLPFTLGTYLIEGATGTKNGFAEMRALRGSDPELCRDILSLLAKNIGDYACYQIESGVRAALGLGSGQGWATRSCLGCVPAASAPYQYHWRDVRSHLQPGRSPSRGSLL